MAPEFSPRRPIEGSRGRDGASNLGQAFKKIVGQARATRTD
ncbi:MAG: hypothetical protein NVSMB6_24710 [Burkholderiaceae bacterium]